MPSLSCSEHSCLLMFVDISFYIIDVIFSGNYCILHFSSLDDFYNIWANLSLCFMNFCDFSRCWRKYQIFTKYTILHLLNSINTYELLYIVGINWITYCHTVIFEIILLYNTKKSIDNWEINYLSLKNVQSINFEIL